METLNKEYRLTRDYRVIQSSYGAYIQRNKELEYAKKINEGVEINKKNKEKFKDFLKNAKKLEDGIIYCEKIKWKEIIFQNQWKEIVSILKRKFCLENNELIGGLSKIQRVEKRGDLIYIFPSQKNKNKEFDIKKIK